MDDSGKIYASQLSKVVSFSPFISTSIASVAGSDQSGVADGIGTYSIFSSIHAMTWGPSKSYIAITDGLNVRKVLLNPYYAMTPTWAGPFTDTLYGIVMDSNYMHLYVSTLYQIFQIEIASQTHVVYCGMSSVSGYVDGALTVAEFSGSKFLAVDSQDKIVIADVDNYAVREIYASNVYTLAGNTLTHGLATFAGFSSLSGIVVISDGVWILMDYSISQESLDIRKITPSKFPIFTVYSDR